MCSGYHECIKWDISDYISFFPHPSRPNQQTIHPQNTKKTRDKNFANEQKKTKYYTTIFIIRVEFITYYFLDVQSKILERICHVFFQSWEFDEFCIAFCNSLKDVQLDWYVAKVLYKTWKWYTNEIVVEILVT